MNKFNIFSKFNKKSSIALFCAVLCLVLSVVLCNVERISAYLSDSDQAVNSMKIGENTITVDEEFETPEPNKKTVKRPTAVNTGKVDCYVRCKILLSDSRAGNYLEYYNNSKLGFNTEDWVEDEDGWFYYDSILEVGEQTSPVFTHIKLLDGIPDAFLGFTIDVVFESVQSNDFDNAQDAFYALSEGGGL